MAVFVNHLPATAWLKKNLILIASALIVLFVICHPSMPRLPGLFRKKAEWERFASTPHQLPATAEDADAVEKIDDKLFVFSAFFDDISDPNKTFIRIVAIDILTREWKPPLNCYFYGGKNYEILKTVPSTKVVTKVAWKFRKSKKPQLTFFLCEIPPGWFPTFVQLQKQGSVFRIADNDTAWKDHLMKIHYEPSKESQFLYQVAMCVQPLEFPLAKAPLFLLEWIEYYLLLGVEHITFYNYNVSLEITALLDSYSKGGKVRVLDWSPGVQAQNRLTAQWVAASDCAHRYRGVAKYVIAVDTDEFLVPSKKHDTFPKYFDELWKDRNISHVQFSSKFWFNSFPRGYYSVNLGDERFNKLANELLIPTATTFFWSDQKKIVMRPDLVVESGVHCLSYSVKGSTTKVTSRKDVENGEGFYLHYRDCSPYYHRSNTVISDKKTCLETKGSFQDVHLAKRFGNILVGRVVDKINGSLALKKMFL